MQPFYSISSEGDMQISIDLSLYPLADQQYKAVIWQFIKRLNENNAIKVVSNGMSTQVFGEYQSTVDFVMSEIKRVHQQTQSGVFIIKMMPTDRDRTY